MVSDYFFTPGRELYHSERDGLWDFKDPELSELVDRALPALPIKVVADQQEVVLNSLESPKYLVENKTSLNFNLEEKQELWLRFEFEAETQETDRGFDDPALVIFLDETVVWKRSVKDICCDKTEKTLYLGEVETGNHALHFYAGETGDLQKPTQVKIKNLEVLVNAKTQELFVLDKVEKNTQQESGETLGVTISQPKDLERLVFHPWAFVVVWLVMLIVVTVIWELVNKNSFMKGGDYDKNLKK